MKATGFIFACWAALSLCLATSAVPAENAKEGSNRSVIRISGSLPLVDAVERLGASFAQEHPRSVVIVTGGGMKAAFGALSEKLTDMVMASRKARKSETAVALRKGVQLEERLIGSAAVTVFVNPALQVDLLTLSKLKNIYKGEIDRWNEIGGPDVPIEPCSLHDGPRGPAGWFRTNVMESAEFGPRTEFFEEELQIITRVASSPAGIGYMSSSGLNSALASDKGLKVTVIGLTPDSNTPAVLPSPETVKDRSYPLTRSLFFYWDGRSANRDVSAFVDFCTTKAVHIQ